MLSASITKIIKNIIELFNSEVSLKLINLAWYSSNQEDNIIRYKLTTKTKDNLYIYLTQKVKMYISFKFKWDSKKYRFK